MQQLIFSYSVESLALGFKIIGPTSSDFGGTEVFTGSTDFTVDTDG